MASNLDLFWILFLDVGICVLPVRAWFRRRIVSFFSSITSPSRTNKRTQPSSSNVLHRKNKVRKWGFWLVAEKARLLFSQIQMLRSIASVLPASSDSSIGRAVLWTIFHKFCTPIESNFLTAFVKRRIFLKSIKIFSIFQRWIKLT